MSEQKVRPRLARPVSTASERMPFDDIAARASHVVTGPDRSPIAHGLRDISAV